jgi:pimeloyl-ACP methyl ester carboxylesterase
MTPHAASSDLNGSSASSKKAKFPTLLVWGREDEVFDHKTFASRFKELLPHAEGPELVTGRHFLQEDSGPEIAEKINNFLDRIDERQP